MAPADSLLSLPAPVAVRRIALGGLDRATEAALRFRGSEDPEALHDFRVGLRRLRATLRSYRELLDEAVPKKLRRSLRDLAETTNLARDTEVQLAWLEQQQDGLRPNERAGYRWLHRHWQTLLLAEYERLREAIETDFAELERKLRPRLQPPLNVQMSLPMDIVIAETLGVVLSAFATALTGLDASSDPERIHPPRLIGKRLRYLIDPFAGEIAAAAPAARALSKLQDLLGDIHDRQVLQPTLLAAADTAGSSRFRLLLELSLHRDADPRALAHARRTSEIAGLIALARRAQDEEQHLLQELRLWIDNGAPDALMQLVRAAQLALGQAAAILLPR
jgi:CHAD domain-containing protein